MAIVIDINSILNGPKAGVAYYLEGWLGAVVPWMKENKKEVVFYSSGWGGRDYPLWLSVLAKRHGVKRFHLPWPNKLITLLMIVFQHPKLDLLVEKKLSLTVDWFIATNFSHWAVKKARVSQIVHDLSLEIYPEFFPLKWRLSYYLINPFGSHTRPVGIINSFMRMLVRIIRLFTSAKHLPDHYIAVSESTKSQMAERWGIDDTKITVCLPILPELLPAGTKLNPYRYWLSVGTIEPRKNLLLILQALEQYWHNHPIDNRHWVIVGGWGWKHKPFRKALAKSPYHDRIHVIGYVTEQERADWYSGADGLLQGSVYEGIGIPPLEAQGYGIPVVSSDAGSLAEMLGQSAVFASRTEATSWIRALELLDDVVIRERLVLSGKENYQRFRSTKWLESLSWII
ncbi:MAG: glycosyltransferase family 1 protein [bacterium]